jgi:hypothetical protein
MSKGTGFRIPGDLSPHFTETQVRSAEEMTPVLSGAGTPECPSSAMFRAHSSSPKGHPRGFGFSDCPHLGTDLSPWGQALPSVPSANAAASQSGKPRPALATPTRMQIWATPTRMQVIACPANHMQPYGPAQKHSSLGPTHSHANRAPLSPGHTHSHATIGPTQPHARPGPSQSHATPWPRPVTWCA